MVRALLAGTKTQTRRLVNSPLANAEPGDLLWVREAWACHWATDNQKPRDIDPELWSVRYLADDYIRPATHPENGGTALLEQCKRGRPSIFMPLWASRLTLRVRELKEEALLDITEADILAEGAPLDPNHRDGTVDGSQPHMCLIEGAGSWATQSPRAWYHRLWDSLHSKPGTTWADNPQIVACSFDTIAANVGDIHREAV